MVCRDSGRYEPKVTRRVGDYWVGVPVEETVQKDWEYWRESYLVRGPRGLRVKSEDRTGECTGHPSRTSRPRCKPVKTGQVPDLLSARVPSPPPENQEPSPTIVLLLPIPTRLSLRFSFETGGFSNRRPNGLVLPDPFSPQTVGEVFVPTEARLDGARPTVSLSLLDKHPRKSVGAYGNGTSCLSVGRSCYSPGVILYCFPFTRFVDETWGMK